MGKVCWDFPLLGTGNQSGNNIAAITMFKGAGVMDGLAREVCQNSLDAKDKSLPADIPVEVKFELVNIKKDDFDIFAGYEEALESSISYWESSQLKTPEIMEFLHNIKVALANEFIPVLAMSDYNTVGLNGVNAKEDEKSFWDLLVNTEGISIKQDQTSAGSFGIGKNAPFAYSALNLVLYNTLAEDGGRALEGVAKLVTTQRMYNGLPKRTQPIGKYLFLEDEVTGRPILPTDRCNLSEIDIFNRDKVGTDVAVVGFKQNEYENWEHTTAVAVIKNFILSIIDGKLKVLIKSSNISYEINKDTLHQMLYDTFLDDPFLKYTRQIYETLTTVQPSKVKIAEKDDLSIYVHYDDNYSQALSRFRSTGMLINTSTNDVLPHFSVIIVVNDVGEMELSKTLREAEPPQHTEWKAKNITDNRALYNKAARYIRSIGKAIQKILDDFEKTEITDKMDAGIGNYLPDATDCNATTEGTDGLKTDVRISEITSYDGRVHYSSQYENAQSDKGKPTSKNATKAGNKKKKKKTNLKIPVVKPEIENSTGVSQGQGKVRIATVKINDHRTFYIAAGKYKLYINSPANYERVYIQYFAGREDNGQDSLVVKNVKIEGEPRFDINSEKIGPVSLKIGSNDFFIEFDSNEIMAVIPVFTMEVSNEK